MAKVIYVAYAYSKENPLHQVPAELEKVIAVFKNTPCSTEREESATQEALENRFALLKKEILVFHFCGHAGATGLELNADASEEMNFIDMSAFAHIIGQDGQGLKLVFLNGCSTQPQVKHLLAQGVPAVIATTWPLDDLYAYRFAQVFYSKFTNPSYANTLQEAFDKTLQSFQANETDSFRNAQGQVKASKLMPVALRGNLDLDLATPTQIYQLEGDAAILQQRFTDWQQSAEKPMVALDLEKPGPAPDQKWELSYLLCDRDAQARDFSALLDSKQAGTQTEPCFLFIHDYGKNCPLELAKRFKMLTLRDAFPQKVRLEELDFPLPEDFDNAADPQKPLHYLAYLYAQKFSRDGGKHYDPVLRRYQYDEFTNDLFVVVHHQLPIYFWQAGIRRLFEYYVGDFSAELPEGLRKKLLVICTFDHTDDADELANAQQYRDLFQHLSALPHCQGRILHCPDLPVIHAAQVRQWYGRVFAGTLNAGQYMLPPRMDFLEAMPIMQTIINDYNRARR